MNVPKATGVILKPLAKKSVQKSPSLKLAMEHFHDVLVLTKNPATFRKTPLLPTLIMEVNGFTKRLNLRNLKAKNLQEAKATLFQNYNKLNLK